MTWLSLLSCLTFPFRVEATFSWTSTEVRAALNDGTRLSELAEELGKVPTFQRADTLIETIQFRFPRGLRLIHYADVHRHRSNLNYPGSIASQIEFLYWLHAHPNALVFAEGLTSDLIAARDGERVWRAADQNWFDAFVPPRPDWPISLPTFLAYFDAKFWERSKWSMTVVSEYPTPAQGALYALGGPRSALVLGETDRVFAAERKALNAAAYRPSPDTKDIYTMLLREAAALLSVERVTRERGVERPVVLVMGKAHDIEGTFRNVQNLQISTITAETRSSKACREDLDAKIRAYRRKKSYWGAIKNYFGL